MASSTNYTVYVLATGQITGTLSTSGGASCATDTVGQIQGTYNPATQFISPGSMGPALPIMRPAQTGIALDKAAISANGTDAATVSGIPAGTTVSLDGAAPVPVTDAAVIFTATTAGTYSLVFSKFPALDLAFSVVAS